MGSKRVGAASRLLWWTLSLPAPSDSEVMTQHTGRPDVGQPMGRLCVTQGSTVPPPVSVLLKRFLLNQKTYDVMEQAQVCG